MSDSKNWMGLPEGYQYTVARQGIEHAERQVSALNAHLARVGSTWGAWFNGDVPGTKEVTEMRDKLQSAIERARRGDADPAPINTSS